MSDQPQAPQVVLVGGGVRSGKSRFALQRAMQLGQQRVFVATAQIYDDEMQRRVTAHQAERGAQFRTVEAPLELAQTLKGLAQKGGVEVVVVDCLTLWQSNLLLAATGQSKTPEEPQVKAQVLAQVQELVELLPQLPFSTVLVSNEVGMGIVPESALGRWFRDIAGTTHQQVAAIATEVHMAMMGMRLRLKPGPVVASPLSLLD